MTLFAVLRIQRGFRVANLAFLKPDFEILAFLNALGIVWKSKKARQQLAFFTFF